jgi:hypothetical protein
MVTSGTEIHSVTSAKNAFDNPQVSSSLRDEWGGISMEELQRAVSSGLDGSDISQSLRVMTEKMSVNSTDSTGRLSQKFFDAMKGVSNAVNEFYMYIKGATQSGDFSMHKLFEVQFKVTQMTVLLDVSSKIGDKGGQAFQTLFRNQ